MEITVKQYQDAIQNALSPKQIEVLQTLYNFPNSAATAKELAAKLNYASYHPANRQIGAIGEAIAKYNNIDILQHYYYIDRGEKKPSYFYVVGPYDKESGWEMWDNLRTALENSKLIDPVPVYQTCLFNWDSKPENWEDIDFCYEELEKNGECLIGWLCDNANIKRGDRAFLIKRGKEPEGIIGSGIIRISPYKEEGEMYCVISFDKLLDFKKDNILKTETFKGELANYNWMPQKLGVIINPDIANELETVWESIIPNKHLQEPIIDFGNNTYSEGTPISVTHTIYERDQNAREKCKEHYRAENKGLLSCEVCHFNFELTYGELGKDFIHIHHLTPISQIGENYQIDPTADLVPVCPNCHSMIHRKKGVTLTIEELKSQIKSSKK